jgi:hypothetical protein
VLEKAKEDTAVLLGQLEIDQKIADEQMTIAAKDEAECAGVAASVKRVRPGTRVYGVEAVDSDAMALSLAAGRASELYSIVVPAAQLNASAVSPLTARGSGGGMAPSACPLPLARPLETGGRGAKAGPRSSEEGLSGLADASGARRVA